MNEQTTATFDTPPGGVMTDEVGAITGTVVVTTTPDGDATQVLIAYDGSTDTYRVDGSPLPGSVAAADVAEHLAKDPGVDSDDNAAASTLRGYPN